MTTKKPARRADATKSPAMRFLDELAGGPLTVGGALEALREADDLSQVDMARRLGVTRQHLCDIEKGRRLVSPGRAAGFARKLRHSQALFIRLAVQDQLSSEGIEARVTVDVA